MAWNACGRRPGTAHACIGRGHLSAPVEMVEKSLPDGGPGAFPWGGPDAAGLFTGTAPERAAAARLGMRIALSSRERGALSR